MTSAMVGEGVEWVRGVVNLYVVARGDGAGSVTLVDGGFPGQRRDVEAALRGRRIAEVVVTHCHADHVGLCGWAQKTFGATVWVPEGDAGLARHPLLAPSEKLPVPYVARERATRRLYATSMRLGAWRQVLGVRGFQTYAAGETVGGLRAIATPGHTKGHTALLLGGGEGEGVLFTGDALVTEDPYTGRTGPRLVAKAATWSSDAAAASLSAIEATGAGTLLTGHGEPWTTGAEAAVAAARVATQA